MYLLTNRYHILKKFYQINIFPLHLYSCLLSSLNNNNIIKQKKNENINTHYSLLKLFLLTLMKYFRVQTKSKESTSTHTVMNWERRIWSLWVPENVSWKIYPLCQKQFLHYDFLFFYARFLFYFSTYTRRSWEQKSCIWNQIYWSEYGFFLLENNRLINVRKTNVNNTICDHFTGKLQWINCIEKVVLTEAKKNIRLMSLQSFCFTLMSNKVITYQSHLILITKMIMKNKFFLLSLNVYKMNIE